MGFGQEWEQIYTLSPEYETGVYVQEKNNEGYLVYGSIYNNETTSQSLGSIYLLNTDGFGSEVSLQIGDEINGLSINDIDQTIDGGHVIFGTISMSPPLPGGYTPDVCIIKMDDSGNEEWTQTYGYGYSGGLEQNPDGGYVFIVNKTNYPFDYGGFMFKTNSTGDTIWTQQLNENGGLHSIQPTLDGGYIIIGETMLQSPTDENISLYKTDENGNIEWVKNFGTSTYYENGYNVISTIDGGYIISGTREIYPLTDKDIYIIKTDENGDEEWSQTYDGSGGDDWGYIQQTIDGGYILYGQTIVSQDDQNSDVYLIKIDGSGNEVWSRTFGDINNEIRFDMCSHLDQTSDGGYVLTGNSFYNFDSSNTYMIKTNEWGSITSTIELPTPTSKRELVKTTNILGQENTTIKNQPLIEIYDDGSTEKKIVIE